MISIEIYRMRIGAHCSLARHRRPKAVKKRSKVKHSTNSEPFTGSSNQPKTVRFYLAMTIVSLIYLLLGLTFVRQLILNHEMENSPALIEYLQYVFQSCHEEYVYIFHQSLILMLNSLGSVSRTTLKRINFRTTVTFINFFCAYFFMLKLLLAGDVELNPGPTYNLVKVVKASLHQGNPMFGITAGTQCACNALFSICWALWKNAGFWNSDDLDYVLIRGDEIRKGINLNRYLGMEDLPNNVDVEGNNVRVENIALITVELKIKEPNFLRPLFKRHGEQSNGIIIYISRTQTTFSLVWNAKSFFLFDSHSRDEYGQPCLNGTAILLKFSCISQIQKYVLENYLANADYESEWCQLQFVKTEIGKTMEHHFSNHSKKRKADECSYSLTHELQLKKRREKYASNKGSSEHCDLLSKLRNTYASKIGTQEHNKHLENRRKDYERNKGTPDHEKLLENLCNQYKTKKSHLRQQYENKKGTPEHELYLENRRQQYEHKKGTPEHKLYLENRRQQYEHKKGTPEHEVHLENRRQQYENKKGTPEHEVYLENRHRQYENKKGTEARKDTLLNIRLKNIVYKQSLKDSMEKRIRNFKRGIMEGPVYICTACHRGFWKRTVLLFKDRNYNFPITDFYLKRVISFNGKIYICITCNKDLKKGKIPCQAVCNKLEIYDLPVALRDINRLERVLIAKRLLFKKVVIMPKGNSPKLKGAICNVPINVEDVCDVLPRPACSNGLLLLKLKRKLMYRGHVYFESVRPRVLNELLRYLKQHNPLYNSVTVDIGQISEELFLNDEINDADDDLQIQRVNFENEEGEEEENPFDHDRIASNETIMASKIPIDVQDDLVTVAPGEGKRPIPIYEDEHCEEMAFPHLFPTGKFGFNVQRNVKLSPIKYFNQRLLNYTQKFASDTDYIFFANHVVQQMNLRSKINIAMKKVCGSDLTAGMLKQNYKESMQTFLANDQAFNFMNTIKGTPAYWKRFLLEVLAMVKQLGIPTFFLTLSSADLRWFELPFMLAKLYNLVLTEEQIENMSYEDRCRYLNMNPIFTARHFQYRVQLFFKEILVDGPLGKLKYHAIRVEFQVRGSPHVHVFLWILNPPVLHANNKEEYIAFVDSIIRADLPDKTVEPELFKLVKSYQVHKHSLTCRKYKNKPCRFNFGHYFTDRTIISVPVSEDVTEEEKENILENRLVILEKVKSYIDEFLYPHGQNIVDPDAENYVQLPTIPDILQQLGLTENEYYNALSISKDSDFEIHLRRPPNSCFVNNYFAEGLLAWEANMDIQPVFNQYKAVTYMCKYISKTEDECSKAMKQALKEAQNNDSDKFQQMLQIAKAYSTNRELSGQEAAYHILPGLSLRDTFPKVIFANSNVPEKRFRVLKSKQELSELPEESTDIFKQNMLGRYVDRPNASYKNGKYIMVDKMCFAEFLAHYYIDTSAKDENDSQPIVFDDDVMEQNKSYEYPASIPLMSCKTKLKCRKTRAVIRFGVPNRHRDPEGYAHHLLQMYYPHRKESDLLNSTYVEKLAQPEVLTVVNENKQKIEPFEDLVDEAFAHYNADLETSLDPFAQQENEEVENTILNSMPSHDVDEEVEADIPSSSASCGSRASVLPDNEINEQIRSLNCKQREIFEVVLSWAVKFIKNRNCKNAEKVDPLHIFLTGEGGCGKSHLVKIFFHCLSKLLLRRGANPEKPRVLLFAPTGVAAIRIDGTTIHSGLAIHGHSALSDKMRASLRNKLKEAAVVIVDEISMVSEELLKDTHLRLCEIADVSTHIPFAGKTVITVGDLFQLPPVMGYAHYLTRSVISSLLKLWQNFKIAELTEVMRQQGEDANIFIDLLNSVRVANISSKQEELIKERFISKDATDYPMEALHLFAENKPALEHNIFMLNRLDGQLIEIHAIDEFPKHVSNRLIDNALNRKQSDTGGLARVLSLKIGAKVMVTVNIDISDKLVNGQIGTVKNISFKNGKASKIYVKFPDDDVGVKAMGSDPYAKHCKYVPIVQAETNIHMIKKSLSSPAIKRTQFPLMLAWAVTIHKVQGLGVPEAVISFDLEKQTSFNPGQMYVAMSRVKYLSGLHFTGTYNKKVFKADKKAFEEYERMRQNAVLQPPETTGMISDQSLTICLLNTRSISLHASDIVSDQEIMRSDVLCLTETQLIPNQDTTAIEAKFEDFQISFNSNDDKFISVACGVRSSISVKSHSLFPAFSLVKLNKVSFSDFEISLGIFYRKKENSLSTFYDDLVALVSSNNIHILLGDFNLNFFEKRELLNQTLSDYTMIVLQPTHIDGGLLDHVYVKKDLLKEFDVSCLVKCVFFSDHDAVKVKFTKKNSTPCSE